MTLARLRAIAEAIPRPGYDWESRPTFAPPASPATVVELESAAGFVLPADFRAFLADTAIVLGMSVHNGYQIGGPAIIVRAVRERRIPLTVAADPAIPVAFDGGGNAFLLTQAGDVWKWDHETGAVSPVVRSFAAFLDRVALDWAAYVANTPDWRFLV